MRYRVLIRDFKNKFFSLAAGGNIKQARKKRIPGNKARYFCRFLSRKFLKLTAWVIIGLNLLPTPAFSQMEFYYFNPDSLQSNLGRLKAEMDLLFSREKIHIIFQPFAHFTDFDRKARQEQPTYLFLPSWYLVLNQKELHLRPLLTPSLKGERFYKKILIIAGNSDLSLQNITHQSLALTSIGPEKNKILNELLFSAHDIEAGQLNTVIVPKDTDALFALMLGQVDMALVVEENYKNIITINPRIAKTVKIIAETKPIPMPVLCFHGKKASTQDVEKIKRIFLNAVKAGGGEVSIMEMLNIDEWQTIKN